MKALFYLGPKKMEMRSINDPSSEDSVVIKVIEAGICGTDVKTFLRGHHMFTPPVILGHECYGVVVKKPGFMRNLEIGDYVVVAPYGECGVCEKCLKGFPELCERKTFLKSGCFAQYIEVPIEHAYKGLFKIERPISHMILAEPLACVLGALRKIPRVEKPLIVGGGVMGSLFATYLASRGVEVRIVELFKWRLSFLRKQGFHVVRPTDLGKQRSYDTVILASTIDDPFSYLDFIQDGGILMIFGGYPKDAKLELYPFHIHYREVSILGSFGYSLQDFARAVEELRNEESRYAFLITHSYKLDEYRKAFEKAISRECMKVSIRMWDGEEEETS